MSIGSQIEELLYEKNMSQKQLAEDLRILPSTLNGYVRDYREPDAETLKVLADYFSVTIDYLFEYKVLRNCQQLDRLLDERERELLNICKDFKKDQQYLLIEFGKLLAKVNRKRD